MEYDQDKVDDMTLALLYLVMSSDQYGTRAWKGFSLDTLDRLHAKGYIENPKSKALSVYVTDEGRKRAKELFEQYFAKGQKER
jgi:hypothetical protein